MSKTSTTTIKKKLGGTYRAGDFWILILTLMISAFGVVMDFSASYYVALSKFNNPFYYLKNACIWFVIGWIAFIITANIDYHLYAKKWIALTIIGGGFVLLFLVYTPLGTTLNNATRWIEVGPITIMPGEVIKTCFIIFFSWFFAEKPSRISNWKTLGLAIVIAVSAFGLIYLQPNFSTALTVLALAFAMMFIAGLSWKPIVLLAGCGVVGGFGLFVVMRDKFKYMLTRITDFWDPFKDSLGSGYQVCQGLLAIGSGGFFGIGLGNSIQKAFYLPEPQSDFILAIIGEELGLCGMLCLMIAYLALVYSLLKVGNRAKDRFGMYLASGVGMQLGLQVILNIAVVTASAPATGIALPLVTLGGNATALFMAELGIAYNVSKQSRLINQ